MVPWRGELGNRGSAPLPKKVAQKLLTFGLKGTAQYLRAVVQPGVPEQVVDGPGHPSLGIPGTEHHPANLGEHDRPGTLGTGLERDVQRRVGEPIGPGGGEGTPDGYQFGVSGGVPPSDGFVASNGHDFIAPANSRADGDLTDGASPLRFGECELHPQPVGRTEGWPASLAHAEPVTRANLSASPTRKTRMVSPSS